MEPNSAKVFLLNTSSPRVLWQSRWWAAAYVAQDALAASKTGIEGSSGSLGSKGPAFTAVRFRWGGGGHYNFHGYNFHQDIVHNNINVIGNGNGYRGGGWNGGGGPNWGGVGAGVAIGAGIATAAAAAAATTYPPPPVVYGYPYPHSLPGIRLSATTAALG